MCDCSRKGGNLTTSLVGTAYNLAINPTGTNVKRKSLGRRQADIVCRKLDAEANPEDNPDVHILEVNNIQARAWSTPSVEELVQQIRSTGSTSRYHSVFYNGFCDIRDGYHAARDFATQIGGIVYDQSLPNDFYIQWSSPGRETPEQTDMRIAALSAAFARASTGGTYIVIPEGTTLYTGDSVWTDFELPNLTDSTLNPYVHQITVVEYDSSKSASQMKTTILWKIGNPKMGGPWPPRVKSEYKSLFN